MNPYVGFIQAANFIFFVNYIKAVRRIKGEHIYKY